MSMFLFWCAIGIVAGTVFGSLFEWVLHRYIMHRSFLVKFFRYPFERHTLVHHHIFKADHTYHLIHEPDKKTIPMAWWNGPVLVAIGLLPFLISACIFEKWGLLCGAAAACSLYFTAYEYMHWCMHLPKTARRAIGNFLSAQWPSSAASSLHEQKLQRRPAAGRLVSRNIVAAFEGCLRAGEGSVGAKRSAQNKKRQFRCDFPEIGQIIKPFAVSESDTLTACPLPLRFAFHRGNGSSPIIMVSHWSFRSPRVNVHGNCISLKPLQPRGQKSVRAIHCGFRPSAAFSSC